MATLRSDLIIPEIFTPIIEQTTQLDAFLASGDHSSNGRAECY